jgi:hypothetical protein
LRVRTASEKVRREEEGRRGRRGVARMRAWRARVSVAVAVAAVLLAMLVAGAQAGGRRVRKPARCVSDAACGSGKVCLATGLCGLPASNFACTATRKCSAEAPSDTKRCDGATECVDGLTCASNTGIGYRTCMCPGDTKWLVGGLLTPTCGLGAPGVGGPWPLPTGCGCEGGKWFKSPGSSECVDEVDCPEDDSDDGALTDPAADGAKSGQPAPPCGANEQWYDVVPCPAKCRASDAPVMCSMVVRSGCGCTTGLASIVDGSVVCKARSECDANAA